MKTVPLILLIGVLPIATGLARAADASAHAPCVAVEGSPADASYLRCLSEGLATALPEGDRLRRAREEAAVARAPQGPAAQGLYTQAATRLRLGPNFGHSVVPYRPAVEYRSPLLPPGAGNVQ